MRRLAAKRAVFAASAGFDVHEGAWFNAIAEEMAAHLVRACE
jgi:hypothetical protein